MCSSPATTNLFCSLYLLLFISTSTTARVIRLTTIWQYAFAALQTSSGTPGNSGMLKISDLKNDIELSTVLQPITGSDDELVGVYNNMGVQSLMDKHAPLPTKEITVRPNTPWYTSN